MAAQVQNAKGDVVWRGEQFANHVRDKVLAAMRSTAPKMEQTSKAMAPVDTGALKASIRTEITEDGNSASLSILANTSHAHPQGTNYAYYQEVGWPGGTNTPFLLPALMANLDSFFSALKV